MTFLRSNLALSVLALSLVTSACGDNRSNLPPDDGRDDTRTPLAACEKFVDPDGVLDTFPATYDGSLATATADLSVEVGQCAQESAPFGVEVPGPDSVIGLQNLTPGVEYMVRMYSASDLAMYVSTDCDDELQGPSADGCLMFSDQTVQPPEIGTFVAPDSGQASIVVDYFLNATPVAADFSVDVYPVECSTDDECGGDYCIDARCVPCQTSFDCSDPTHPICDARSNTCVAGDDACTNDDATEGLDDGPAGGPDVTPNQVDDVATATGHICNVPSSEIDFFSFEVAEAGESFVVDLDWPGSGLDLDLGIFDASGRQLGASLWQSPESIELTYLPTGTYYVAVSLFGGTITEAQPYTVTVTRTGEGGAAEGCSSAADCASAYDTQIYRGECGSDGACYDLHNDTPAANGASCDSADDCDSEHCSAFTFAADLDTRATCTSECVSDTDCSGLGDFVCTDYLLTNLCVPACESDDQCPVLIGNPPSCDPNDTACLIDPPTWQHLTCNTGTGKCEFPN